MAAMYEETLKNFTEGSIVTGRVLEVRANEVLVDIGYKSEGLIPADEFEDLATIKAGDEVDVLLERLEDDDGMVVLSKQRAEAAAQLGPRPRHLRRGRRSSRASSRAASRAA